MARWLNARMLYTSELYLHAYLELRHFPAPRLGLLDPPSAECAAGQRRCAVSAKLGVGDRNAEAAKLSLLFTNL